MKKYYSTQRPIMLGGCPKRGLVEFYNYDRRQMEKEIGREVWGYVLYNRELTEK